MCYNMIRYNIYDRILHYLCYIFDILYCIYYINYITLIIFYYIIS